MIRNPSTTVRLGLLLGLATALWFVENLLPIPSVIPGARLGLANVVLLVVVVRFDLKEALFLNLARGLLVSLITVTTFGFTFMLSLGGGVSAALAMAGINRWWPDQVSAIGLSIAGAFAHNLTQVILAIVLLGHRGIIFYLPYFLIFSLPTGFFTGIVAHYILQATGWQRIFGLERGKTRA